MNGSKNSPDDLHPLDRLHLDGDRLTRAGRKISGHLRKAALFDSAHGVQRQLDGGAGPNFDEAKIARGTTFNPVGFKSANADAATTVRRQRITLQSLPETRLECRGERR